jgi:hypothetical protein
MRFMKVRVVKVRVVKVRVVKVRVVKVRPPRCGRERASAQVIAIEPGRGDRGRCPSSGRRPWNPIQHPM